MKDGNFSFKSFTDKEKAKIEKEKREAVKASEEAFQSTVACLSSDQFVKYREDYQKGKETLIQAGINLVFDDPMSYAMASHAIFMRLEFLGKLEDFIQRDLRKGK